MALQPARVNVLGVGVSAITMEMALAQIDAWIASREQQYVCVTGVHGVMESQRDPALRSILCRSGLTTPDGMPLVWLSKLHGFRHVERVYGPDLLLATCERSVGNGHRHFLYGGDDALVEALAEKLRQRYPGIAIVGAYAPPFRPLTPDEDADVTRRINEAQADIVWVGLSTPKQERWMAEHHTRLSAPVMIGVGAAFDFGAGRKRQAPRWMQRSGIEWFFRLVQEPRRLWRRYVINNPRFVALVLLQVLHLRRWTLPDTHDEPARYNEREPMRKSA
jgi:N-acetylglucosaminyldiphosphoundecaprenol N-acetyl-beta-D-mannosaminyltransferase